MADITSELPIRSQLPGQVLPDDVIVKIGDGANPTTQFLGIDSSGRTTVKLDDGAGNAITSQVNGAQRALDVGINVAGVQIDPRAIRALTASDVVTANQGSAAATHAGYWWTRISDGTNDVVLAPASTAAGALQAALVVALSPNSPLPAGSNVIGSVNQGTSPWIVKDQADGSATGGTAASFSMLAGGLYNSSLPTLTTGQQSALQLDSSGRLIIRPLTSADVVTSAQGAPNTAANAWPTKITDGTNTAAVKAASTAAGATDPALVVSLSPNSPLPAGTNLLGAVNLDIGGSAVSPTNPVPVSFSNAPIGSAINDYNTASAVAAAATSNHDYTITASKTFQGKKIWASASGLIKIEVQISADGTTFVSKWVGFNSTSTPNITIDLDQMVFLESGTGSKIRIIRTNLDKKALDVYSTISGTEV